jgi:hypothetical protein
MTKRTLIVLSLSLAAAIGASGQDCTTSGKLVCLVPFVSSSANPYLVSGTPTETTALFATANGEVASQLAALNGPIGAQLSQLPVAASVSGLVTYRDASGNDVPYNNLGPILLDRPDGVGRGKLVFGGSFEQFNFNSLDGIGLGNVPLVYTFPVSGGPNADTECPTGTTCTFYYSQTEKISLKYQQYVFLATYGLSKKTDFSVIVPFARVSMRGTSTNGVIYFLNQSNNQIGTSTIGTSTTAGEASGLGDIALNVKHVLWSGGETGRGSLAGGVTVRLPTGDAENYLGSDAVGVNAYALFSYKWLVSPHARIGYQWNTDSLLVQNNRLPGGTQFAAGVDIKLNRAFTVSVDVLGNELLSAPVYTINSNYMIPTVSTPFRTVVANPKSSYTSANLSTGLKWKPFKHYDLVAYGNMLTQLNNVGLRSDLVPSGGISYSFGLKGK